jgi:hypothetical protein
VSRMGAVTRPRSFLMRRRKGSRVTGKGLKG